VLDHSGYVRAKGFNVLAKIVNIKTYKFPKYRLQMVSHAAGALDDKLATVRKAAISLLKELLMTHPYGLPYGGTLQQETWEKVVITKLEKFEGAMGNIVKNPEGETGGDEDDDDEQEEGVDEDGSSRKQKSLKSV